MKLIANYEIKSKVSVIHDNQWLTINHPRGLYRARISNIVRSDFSEPFLLSLNINFDAPSIESSQEIADDHMVDCLNIISLSTNSPVIKHRIRQIIDANPDITMRTCLFWSDTIGNEDPEPILDENFGATITKLLSHEMPPSLQKALRWFRMGLCAATPDDQFQYFWFALELIATSTKSISKINDKCPQCKQPLFCNSCKKHPTHKPYLKEKIYNLIREVVRDLPETLIEQLGETRNRLMHGDTLREIQQANFKSNEDIVDVLGKIVFEVLISQFPAEILKNNLLIGRTSTYLHKTLTGVAHITTVVPIGPDGEFDMSFKGITIKLESYPPQSGIPSFVFLTDDNMLNLKKAVFVKGDYQDVYKRIYERMQTIDNVNIGAILSTDMEMIVKKLHSEKIDESLTLIRDIFNNPVPLIEFN